MPVLPFLYDARLLDQGGAEVAPSVPCSIWPTRSAGDSDVGRHHTHRGEASLEYADELQGPNRKLEIPAAAGAIAGTYRVVGASVHTFVPHVALELLRTSGRS